MQANRSAVLLIAFVLVGWQAPGFAALPALDAKLGTASARTEGDVLIVSTGAVERRWRWTGHGLVTVGLADQQAQRQWIKQPTATVCDWEYPGLIDANTRGQLVSLTARPGDDEGFTSKHLEVVAEVAYPTAGVSVQHRTWVYPGTPGVRSQLWVKGEPTDPAPAVADDAPAIRPANGRAYANADAKKVAPHWQASVLLDNDQLKVRLLGLEDGRRYTMGVSWWDYGGGGRRQRVVLTSVDGEARHTAVNARTLPGYLKGRNQLAESLTFDVPSKVRPDGTVTVLIDNVEGPNANAGEFWLYEHGADTEPPLKGDAKRLTELKRNAPKGSKLVAYHDAGAKAGAAAQAVVKRIDYLPIDPEGLQRRAIGYFNDTQHRHKPANHLIRDEVTHEDTVKWASIFALEDQNGGVALLKESHKCANQAGVDTGDFRCLPDGLHNTGWAMSKQHIQPDRWLWCWASAAVVYDGTDDGRELALKQYDRARYPVVLGRDMYAQANTWGSGDTKRMSQDMAQPHEVIRELKSVADLGLDKLQIDDGWQVSGKTTSSSPDGGVGWKPHPKRYPDGWQPVLDEAKRLGVNLGIWTAAGIGLDDMKWNYDRARFSSWKYDFAHLGNYPNLVAHTDKLRAFIEYTGRKAQIAMDVTENAPRFGYFWNRQYGCIWLSNRKPNVPTNVIPHPWLMLRENWQLARYVNLNKFQLPVQNFQRVNREVSDAYKHPQDYAVALGLPGIPVFFQTTYHYDEDSRQLIRPLVALYKKHREAMFTSYVFAIGDEPTNASWAGFQWYHPRRTAGHLLVFRELNNPQATKKIALRFYKPGTTLKLTDLRTNETRTATLDAGQRVELTIGRPADFAFIKYEVAGQ